MSFRIEIVSAIIMLLVSCKQAGSDINESIQDDQRSLVEVLYLFDQKDNKDVKIIDFRIPQTYKTGHIPGAINIWRTNLENENYPYGGMMPTKEHVEELFSSLGIENDDMLVVYDDKGSVDAARLWWILSYYEFNRIKILNGGLSAWKEAGGTIDQSIPKYAPSQFTLADKQSQDIYADKEKVEKWVNHGGEHIKIVDARTAQEFTGELQKKGASRSGRIPESIRIEWIEAIDTVGSNKFKNEQELLEIYGSRGINSNDSIIIYCHSGSRSSHTTFVLKEILKYKSVMNYDGSWTEWSYYEHLPIEKDSLTLTLN